MTGSGRFATARTVPLSTKSKTSNKSMAEETLFDPFGIASEISSSGNRKPRSLFLEDDGFGSLSLEEKIDSEDQYNMRSSSQSHLLKTPLHHSSAQSPRGPPEVSRVTRSPRLTFPTNTNASSSESNLTTTRLDFNSDSSASATFFAGSRTTSSSSRVRSSGTTGSTSLRTLPPKLQVRMTKYEEVASQAFISSSGGNVAGEAAAAADVGTATVSVEGSLYVQVQGSDALKNAPFALRPSLSPCSNSSSASPSSSGGSGNNKLSIKPNTRYTTQTPPSGTTNSTTNAAFSPPSSLSQGELIVHVPKSEIGFVPVIHYSFQQTMAHMPVLLERKVTIHETSCRIALQVRSKLTNKGDLRDFCLAVAIPEHVDASSVEILRGNGTWDPLVRLIKFRLDHLPKGESFMVSAQAKLWKPHRPAMAAADQVKEGEEKVANDGIAENGGSSGDPPIIFPVMLRCSSSEDQMSDVEFDAVEALGIPCSITTLKAHSFRLLHRLT